MTKTLTGYDVLVYVKMERGRPSSPVYCSGWL